MKLFLPMPVLYIFMNKNITLAAKKKNKSLKFELLGIFLIF